MAILTYSGNVPSALSLNSARAVSMSGSPVSNAVSNGVVTARLFCSTNAYANTYNINVSVGGYQGSASFKFDSSNYTGATITVQISVGAGFNVNGVSSISVWDSTGNASKVFIKYAQYLDVGYNLPTPPTAPTTVKLNNVSGNVYVLAGSDVTLSWSGASAGSYNPITGYAIYRNGSLYASVGSGTASYTVPAHASSGSSYYYHIVTLGTYSDSPDSTQRYVYSYAAASPPSSVSPSNATPDAGAEVTLSWPGAVGGGTYNPITGYAVYRATSEGGEYTLLDTVETTSTSGSLAVTAHATMGSSYWFKVITLCERANSGYSDATSITSKVYTACSAPSVVTLNGAAANAYVVSGNVTLAWSGAAAGTNNAISGYDIYRNGILFDSVSSSTSNLSAPSHETAGSAYAYTVVTKGAAGEAFYSSASVARSVYTVTAPSPPSTITLDGTTAVYKKAGNTALLEWSGAAGGVLNDITGYKVYQGTTLFATVGSNVFSYTVPAHPDAGSSYAYSVVAVGTNTDSAKSTARTFYTFGDPIAPTVVILANETPDAGETVQLSWSNATAGPYNSIIGYDIYRCDTADGVYAKIGTTVLTSSTSGNTNVTAPAAMDASYYYKVLVVGARSNSGISAAYAGMTTLVRTDCTPPSTVTIGGGAAAYAAPSAEVELAWSGAAGGTNNDIDGYKIYRNGTLLATLGAEASSYNVAAHSTVGNSYSYTVVTVGTYAPSAASAAVTLYTYGLPTAPTTIQVSNAVPDAGSSVLLSWSGAAHGLYNSIIGFEVYRSTTSDGEYSLIDTINTTNTYGSTNVTAPAVMGGAYYYKILPVGTHADGTISSGYANITAKVYTAVSAPTSVSLSQALANPGANVTLSWSGAAGGTNTSVAGYQVYRCATVDGVYTALGDPTTATSMAVTANGTQGESYFYKVKALSSPAAYPSGLSTAYVELVANTYPEAPTVDAPTVSTRKTYNPRPRILVTVGNDTNGSAQTIAATGYSVSSSGAQAIGKKLVMRKNTAISSAAAQSVNVIASDTLSAASDPATCEFAFAVKAYTDDDVLSGSTAVKAAHVNELRDVLDDICDYYEIDRTSWAETIEAKVTSLLGWAGHIAELHATIVRIAAHVNDWDPDTTALNISLPTLLTSNAPMASIITQLRDVVKIL